MHKNVGHANVWYDAPVLKLFQQMSTSAVKLLLYSFACNRFF